MQNGSLNEIKSPPFGMCRPRQFNQISRRTLWMLWFFQRYLENLLHNCRRCSALLLCTVRFPKRDSPEDNRHFKIRSYKFQLTSFCNWLNRTVEKCWQSNSAGITLVAHFPGTFICTATRTDNPENCTAAQMMTMNSYEGDFVKAVQSTATYHAPGNGAFIHSMLVAWCNLIQWNQGGWVPGSIVRCGINPIHLITLVSFGLLRRIRASFIAFVFPQFTLSFAYFNSHRSLCLGDGLC